ncbi:DNA-binding protein [Alsobacter metallidurans]|uniref:DNA-binding protein n=1 Tax=Alsobacter metallidurans TaxID=340221 RepID=A0A917I813_9HYPH|nr:hemolysin III family protein [Alsobacter metallidurans]GGH23041.1 DNA-binding protein [Alsobacter metallidurans]
MDGRPAHMTRVYDSAELVADGCVHVLGVAAGVIAAVFLVVLAIGPAEPLEITSVAVYATALVAMLACSAAYNMTPPSRLKWLLRRADHSTIYLMIAGTYTPFMAALKASPWAAALSAIVWTGALGGAALKVFYPGRFDRLSILLYLALGWSIVLAFEPLAMALPSTSLWLLSAGGLLYTFGVIFHVWESLRFQNAIWHAFVLAAAACHYGAVLDCMVLSRAA